MTRIDLRRCAAVLLLPLVLVLSSCGRLTADIDIRSESDVSLRYDIGVDRNVATTARVNLSTLCRQFEPGAGIVPPGGSVTPYSEGNVVGCRVAYHGTARSLGGGILTHDGGQWTFSLKADPRLIKGVPTQLTADQVNEFHVAVTFPGKVTSHNGHSQVDGRTVKWSDPHDAFSADGLQATGEDPPNWPFIAGLVGAALAALLCIGLIVALLTRASRRRDHVQTYVDEAWLSRQHDAERAEQIRSYYAQSPSGTQPVDRGPYPAGGAHAADPAEPDRPR